MSIHEISPPLRSIVAANLLAAFPNVNKISDLDEVFVLSWRPFIISASAGRGAQIVPSGAVGVLTGKNQTFHITSTGKQIIDVYVDRKPVGPVSNYTFSNVANNHTIDVKTQYTIETVKNYGGSISPEGGIYADPGTNVTIRITADAGYYIQDVFIDVFQKGQSLCIPSKILIRIIQSLLNLKNLDLMRRISGSYFF